MSRSRSLNRVGVKPYKLIVSVDGDVFVGDGDCLVQDTDNVFPFGGQPEGEHLCDTMGLDKNVIVEYFNKIDNGKDII